MLLAMFLPLKFLTSFVDESNLNRSKIGIAVVFLGKVTYFSVQLELLIFF